MVHAPPISDAAAGLSVSQALALAGQGIQAATGGPTWVYGEVDGMVRSRAGHLYWCLVDGEARLSVVAFRSGAVRMTATLTRAGIELADGMAIRVFGDLMVYAPKGQVQLRAVAIDPAVSVGQQALARQATRARLAKAGLLDAQKELPMPTVPLKLGVVAPAGQGLGDLLGRLEATPWAWQVWVASTPSEGPALRGSSPLPSRRSADVMRWFSLAGGAGATTAYDSEDVVLTVCSCPAPVMVAVGHTSDRSLADECAFVSVSTPTAAADRLASYVAAANGALAAEGAGAAVAARAALAKAGSVLGAEAKAIDSTRVQALEAMAARAEAESALRGVRRTRQLVMVASVTVMILVVVLAVVLLRGA